MSDVKWIKIVTDIFDDEKMIAIETQQDGYLIEVVWLKLLCLAGKCNKCGLIILSEKFPYTLEMLAKVFRMDIGTVKRAMDIFCELGMIVIEENSYAIANWRKYQNEDGLEKIRESGRKRTQKFRERQKQTLLSEKSNVTCNVTSDVTSSYSYISISDNLISTVEENNTEIIGEKVINGEYKKPTKKKTKAEEAKETNLSLFGLLSADYGFSETQIDVIKNWLLYKAERGESYKEQGMKSLMTVFNKNFVKYGTERVSDAVEYSVSNMYAGVVWNNLERKETKSNGTGRISVPDADAAARRYNIKYDVGGT